MTRSARKRAKAHAIKPKTRSLASYISSRIDLSSLESSRAALRAIGDAGHVTLAQLSERLRLSRGTCNLHLQRLEHEGLLRRYESQSNRAGRPTVIWGWDEPRNLTIALVFDVPYLHASVADFANNAILREVRDLSGMRDRDQVGEAVEDFLDRARRIADQREAHVREGVIFLPGLLDPATGAVRKAANLPVLEEIDFRTLASRKTGVACHTAPLGLAYYFGESEFFAPDANAMVLFWDLGVGVVFGHGNRLCPVGVNPDDGRPTLPELGHIRIAKNGRPCHCGRAGCLEAYTGGWALMEMQNGTNMARLGDLIDLIDHNDPHAVRNAARAALILGRHLAPFVHLMGTEILRICGPMASVFHKLEASFRKGLASFFTPEELGRLDIKASPPREERFLRGAHRLARRLFIYPEEYALLPQTPAKLDR